MPSRSVIAVTLPSRLPLIIGHRGASGYRPEHTRAAYELAIFQGADAVEPDLVATSDGVLVIRHENEISGTTDVASHAEFADRRTTKQVDSQALSGWFTEDFTWAELATLTATERLKKTRPQNTEGSYGGILRFRDLLELLDAAAGPSVGRVAAGQLGEPRRVGVVVELKHATYFESLGLALDELLAAELAAAGWAEDDRVTIESFERSVLLKTRARGIRGRLIFLIEADGAPADEVAVLGTTALPYSAYLTTDALAELSRTVDGISVDKHILEHDGAALVERAHAAGLAIYCWTLRAENRFLPPGLRSSAAKGEYGDWMTEFTGLMRLGVDGVFADQPDLALRAREAGSRPSDRAPE